MHLVSEIRPINILCCAFCSSYEIEFLEFIDIFSIQSFMQKEKKNNIYNRSVIRHQLWPGILSKVIL